MTTTKTATRVLVADDQRMFVEIIREVINAEPDLGVVATITDASNIVQHLADHQPDVLLLDHDLRGDVTEIARRVRQERPATQIVMMMEHASRDAARSAVAAGCLGVVSKDRSAADLVNAIRSVARGNSVAAVSNLDAIFGIHAEVEDSGFNLTARQLEILRMMADGLSTDALATALFISRNTIRSHVHQILSKLDARTKLEAVAIAHRRGLIT